VTQEQRREFDQLAAELRQAFLGQRRAWKRFKWHRNGLRRGLERVSTADVEAALHEWVAERHRLDEVRSRMRRLRERLGIPRYRATGNRAQDQPGTAGD